MKIICDIKEFAYLIRWCDGNMTDDCYGCPFGCKSCTGIEENIEFVIENPEEENGEQRMDKTL